MRFFSTDETEKWARSRGVQMSSRGQPEHSSEALVHTCVALPQFPGQLTWFCRYLSNCLDPREECLLWVTDSEVDPASANLHLYYRLRESYRDLRLQTEAPGHLFLRHESADLVSFLEIGIVNMWDMWMLPVLDYGMPDHARVFVSHDGYAQLFHRDATTLNEWSKGLETVGCRLDPSKAVE